MRDEEELLELFDWQGMHVLTPEDLWVMVKYLNKENRELKEKVQNMYWLLDEEFPRRLQ